MRWIHEDEILLLLNCPRKEKPRTENIFKKKIDSN